MCGDDAHTDPRLLGAGNDDLYIPPYGCVITEIPFRHDDLAVLTKISGQV